MRPSVWAPQATSVAVVVEGAHLPLRRAGDWWEADIELDAGARYGFIVDGDGPLPDPRTRSQPDGVHGLSEVTGPPQVKSFTGPALADSVFYELHVGAFSESGTFASTVGHLDHLVALGVTTVEVMPVAAFPGRRGWGYDGVDLYAPHHAYGGAAGLAALVEACHARGLAVFLDVVYNHLGPDGNYLPAYGPYFTDAHHTPWGPAVNLASDEVRSFIVDNARMWLCDFGFDGLRFDAVHALYDDSPTHILEEVAQAVAKLAAPKLLVAESETLDPRIAAAGFDGQWFDEFHHALHAVLTGEQSGYYRGYGSLDRLARTLTVPAVARNHLVGFAQNHDQIGNRAGGERLCELVDTGRQRIAAALSLLGPFTPLLFMGEEWAASTPFLYFTDHEDPDLAKAVREGRRHEFSAFGWAPEDVPDPQAETTFLRSRLRWEELADPQHHAMFGFYRDLIALRRERADLRDGEVEVRISGSSHLEMRRGDVAVVVDLADDTLDVRT